MTRRDVWVIMGGLWVALAIGAIVAQILVWSGVL
jgi:hypothetical protein